jgi:hypothetical protein
MNKRFSDNPRIEPFPMGIMKNQSYEIAIGKTWSGLITSSQRLPPRREINGNRRATVAEFARQLGIGRASVYRILDSRPS